MDILVMKRSVTDVEITAVVDRLAKKGLKANVSKGTERTVIGVIGDTSVISEDETNAIKVMHGVENVMRILKPYKLACRDSHKEDTVIDIRGQQIGGKKLAVIAGPCAVENRENLLGIADEVKAAGANFIRGGAFKPRTSPYSFQGLGVEGLKILAEARDRTGMPVVTELMDSKDLDVMVEYADIIQIGARNMQNFRLLLDVGSVDKPILLKRGISATIEEWLMAAEYIMSRGNHKVILCERGIRTYEKTTRNTLDLSCVPVLKQLTHLPIVVDPSHAVGRWDLVSPMAMAAVAAGADGLMVEVHANPTEALSDGEQSLKPKVFRKLMEDIGPIAKVVGRSV